MPNRRGRPRDGGRPSGPAAGAERRWWEYASTAVLVAALLAYANGSAWRRSRRIRLPGTDGLSPGGTELGAGISPAHLGMMGLSLGWAMAEGLTADELGLSRRGIRPSLGWGLLVGALASMLIRGFFAFPLVMNRAVSHPEFQGLSRWRLVGLLGGQFLLGSAVFEELAFRSVLHAKLVRLFGFRRALLLGGGVFAAWHVVITWHNLRRSNLPRALFPFLYGGAMATLFVAGLVLGALRQTTGHVAGSVLAHWLMVANIVLAVAGPRGARP